MKRSYGAEVKLLRHIFLKIHGKMDYLTVISILRSIPFPNLDNGIVIFIVGI